MNGVDEDFLKSFEYHDKACNLNLKNHAIALVTIIQQVQMSHRIIKKH